MIRIIPAMRLTGAGKIFKPALKNREIEYSLVEALRDAGVRACLRKVHSEPRYGTTVHVSVAESCNSELVRQVLGQLPFPILALRSCTQWVASDEPSFLRDIKHAEVSQRRSSSENGRHGRSDLTYSIARRSLLA